MKKAISLITVVCMIMCLFSVCVFAQESEDTTHYIVLSSVQGEDGTYTNTATVDGVDVTEYDYTWHVDPSTVHTDEKNSPAEYYTGDEPGDESVYIAHDITYYPELDTSGYKKVQYDDETEWAYYYTAEGYTDFIFATLPVNGNSVDTSMMHSEAEAYQNAVLHITEAGTYVVSGNWHGQIKIDLGDDADTDEECKVTLVLNGVNINCTVAPAVNFYSVYECDNTWEDRTEYSQTVDTTNAGANVVIAKNTVNNISGANVFRMLKAKAKSDDEQSSNSKSVTLQKKLVKTDAAFYSYASMNIDGEGTLNITSTYEGLDSELHLSINGGNINIYSQDDGINVNEDKVSVVAFNGGVTHIFAGLGSEGDGIDSNGYLVVNGGTLITTAKPQSDSGLDSDCGSFIYGGTVVALGSTMDGVEADSTGKGQVSINLGFSQMQNSDEAIIVTDTDGNVIFAYDLNQDDLMTGNARTYQGCIISSPELKQGETYNIYVGGDVTGTTENGLFTSENATGFTDDAVMQGYSSNGQGGFNPGGQNGMTPSTGEQGQQGGTTPPEIPTGEQGQQGETTSSSTAEQQGQGTTPPEIPTGEQGEQGQQGGTTPSEMPSDGQKQGGSSIGQWSFSSDRTTEFTMTSVVNNFSGVGDASESADGSILSMFATVINAIINFFNMISEFFKNLFSF